MNNRVDVIEEKFQHRLKALVTAVRAEASGKVCGDCLHYRRSWCAEKTNIVGNALQIIRRDAPSCATYRRSK